MQEEKINEPLRTKMRIGRTAKPRTKKILEWVASCISHNHGATGLTFAATLYILKHGNDRQRDFLEKEISEIAVKWSSILPTLRESENQERQVYANVATKYGAPQQSVATTDFVSIAPIRRTAQKRQESVPLDILETANDDPTTISSMFLQLGKEQAQSARGTTKRARSA